ncbi:hypothetical protein V8F06_013240 [Rhypophila decipiens]
MAISLWNRRRHEILPCRKHLSRRSTPLSVLARLRYSLMKHATTTTGDTQRHNSPHHGTEYNKKTREKATTMRGGKSSTGRVTAAPRGPDDDREGYEYKGCEYGGASDDDWIDDEAPPERRRRGATASTASSESAQLTDPNARSTEMTGKGVQQQPDTQ